MMIYAMRLRSIYFILFGFMACFVLAACSEPEGPPQSFVQNDEPRHDLNVALEKGNKGPYQEESLDEKPTPTPPQTDVRAIANAAIEFTQVPRYGTAGDLSGRIHGADPMEFGVAVFVFTGGWWNKPTWDQPLTPVRPDGSWTADITTGGVDEQATEIVAFLVARDAQVPLARGETNLADEITDLALASARVQRTAEHRRIHFSGFDWLVKSSLGVIGPGPNVFGDAPENVWVDDDGRLHLKIVATKGRWICSEVHTENTFGYGTYAFTLSTPVDQLDQNVVLGLFTWDDAPGEHHREIDIEFSRWGKADNDNAQYVVQPYSARNHMNRFDLAPCPDHTVHSFTWSPELVEFVSSEAMPTESIRKLPLPNSWNYDGPGIPRSVNEKVRINLWLVNGRAPLTNKEVEVVVDSFRFNPQTAQSEN